jgi:hypothetical protein
MPTPAASWMAPLAEGAVPDGHGDMGRRMRKGFDGPDGAHHSMSVLARKYDTAMLFFFFLT